MDLTVHGGDRRAAWLPPLGALLVFGLLALRHIDVLVHAQLVWEDGLIFLTDGISKPWYSTWFTPYIGYYIVMPKMVASLFTPLTMLHAPLVFNAFSLALMAYSFSLPLWPSFAHLAPLRYRALWVAACALMPWHTETLGNLTCTHWFVYYALTLLSLADLTSSRRWTQILLPPLVLLGIFTTPNVVVIVPVLLVRLWLDRRTRGYQFYLHLLTLAGIGVMVLLVRRYAEPQPAGEPADLLGIAAFLVKGLGYKVVIQNLAGGLASNLLQHTVLYVGGASLFMAALAGLAWTARGSDGGTLTGPIAAAGAYYILTSMLIAAVTRPQYVTHFVWLRNYWGADRYFVVPSFYFFLLLVLALKEVETMWSGTRLRVVVIAGYCAVLAMNFRYAPFPDLGWNQQLHTYYQRLLDYPPGTPASTFAIVTFPGEPWTLKAPLYSPADSERPAIQRLVDRLSD